MTLTLQDSKPEEKLLRLFAAIKVPFEVSNRLNNAAGLIFNNRSIIKIIPAENIHLTIKFLGNIEVDNIGSIENALNTAARKTSKFSFNIKENIGAFPSFTCAKIIFAYVGAGYNNIKNLFDLVEGNLEKIGIGKESNKYKGHITLARAKEGIDIGDYPYNNALIELKNINCSTLTLFESVLGKTGPKYSIRKEFEFK